MEAGTVAVDVDDAASEGVHRQLGGIQHRVAVAVWAQRRGVAGETGGGDASEAFPQVIGCAEAEMAELVEILGAAVASRAVGDEQHPDRLDVAVSGLRHAVRSAAERGSSGLDRVDRIGIAVGPSSLPVRSTDLDHGDAGTAQEAGQPSPVGAGALDTDPIKRAEAAQPGVQLAEPSRRRRERPDAEHPAIAVHGAAT